MRALLLLSLGSMACLPRGGEGTRSAFLEPLGPPTIAAARLSCDPEARRWSLEVATESWAGGGELTWSSDGRYVERQPGLRSVRAARDGSADLLRLDIPMVVDFREAGEGNTALGCDAEPGGRIAVQDLERDLVDCVRFGDDPRVRDAVPAPPAVPDCDRLISVVPEDTAAE